MNSFFNYDGPFFTILNRLSDLVTLNLLYILCCLPVVTIGASTTALYYSTLKIVNGEEGYITKNFFKSFKQNFKQSTIIWLIMVLFGAFVLFDLYECFYVDFGLNNYVLPVVFFITLIYSMILVFIFPLQSKFENKIKHTFKNAAILSIRHLPQTLLFIACIALEVFLMLRFIPLAPLWFLAGFAGPAYGFSFLSMRIFKQYIKEEDLPQEVDAAGNDWHIPDELEDTSSKQ